MASGGVTKFSCHEMVLEALICLKPVMLQKTLLFVLTQRSWQVDEHVFKNLQKTRETETMWTHFYKTHTHTKKMTVISVAALQFLPLPQETRLSQNCI